MRKMLLAGMFVALALTISGRASASEGFDELSKLAKAGVGEEVMLAYINASPIAYDLSVDEILFFNDLGVSPKITAAIVKHGKELREAGLAVQAQQPASVAPVVAPAPQVVTGDDPIIGDPTQEQILDAPPIQKPIVEPAPDYQPAPIVSATTVVAPAPGEANLSYFYEALSPYGQWIELDGQWVWQPSAVTVDTNWRPYCHRGHWVYTDAGMAWQSDYSWGWAPFHYGRWASHPRYGWVWSPDTVWGPAWVSWRNSESHCGWAPLPPAARFEAGVGFHFGGKHGSVDFNFGLRDRDYTFVPAERVTETTVTTYVVSQGDAVAVYQQTTVVENPVVYRDDRVVNVGISLDFVKRKTHRDIRPVAIVDINLQAGQAVRGTVVTDASFAVYRPQIRNEAPADPRVVVARRDEAVKREQIRQQELTARTAIVQQNVTQRVQTNQDARTQETIARKQSEVERVQAAQAAAAAAAKARSEGTTAAVQTREIEREQRLTAEQQRQTDLQKAAEQKRQTTIAAQQANLQSAEQKRLAEQAAAAQRLKAEQAAAAERQKELEQKRETSAATAAQRQQAEAAAAAQRQQVEAAAAAQHQKELEQKREATAATVAQRQQTEEAAAAEHQKELAQQRAAEQAAVAQREKAVELKRQQAAAATQERAKEAQAKRDADAAAAAAAAAPDDPKDKKKKTPGN